MLRFDPFACRDSASIDTVDSIVGRTGMAVARGTVSFAALVAAQALHSIEEYVGRLWETFPPARALTGAISADREIAFIVINVALVAFGVWCVAWPVRRRWPSAAAFAWGWVVMQTINGSVHPLWSVNQGGYTPGVLTAPLLLCLALRLAWQLPKPSSPGHP